MNNLLILLVKKAQKGNKKAFTQLIYKCQNELYAIAKTKLLNESDIEDVIQETILLAYKNIKTLRNPQYFKTWIIKILINNCNNIYKIKKNLPLDYANNYYNLDNEDFDNIESRLNFNYIMKTLNEDEKTIMTLYYIKEYSNKEIAEILDIKSNTVRSKISRAREKIKKLYEKEEMRNG